MRYTLLSLLFLFSFKSYAAGHDASLDEFLEHYISAYNQYLNAGDNADIAVVSDHFFEPAMQIPPRGAPLVSPTREVLGKNFSFFLGMLKEKGAVKLEWEKIQLVQVGENNAIASNIARVLDENGKVVDRRSSTYSIYKSGDGWKIAMIQSHPVERLPILK